MRNRTVWIVRKSPAGVVGVYSSLKKAYLELGLKLEDLTKINHQHYDARVPTREGWYLHYTIEGWRLQ